ncbi:hypothetical protein [Bacillus manliponensis]
MKGIWGSFNSFSNAKRVLEIDKYPLFIELLKEKDLEYAIKK